ncbi:2226_t:CDS:2 [Funneliformis geosporum]|uniref:2226_t:CDS:1 n=1 Tax=Funneliformis geosporum TaxID=1117311 RepID=A0A9W4SMS5_9GLOM|nr:2226_t:CDS:2 [Funneliformis geosporum]
MHFKGFDSDPTLIILTISTSCFPEVNLEVASSINDNGTFANLLKEELNSTNLPDMNYQCISSPTWHVISKGINEGLAVFTIKNLSCSIYMFR